MCFLMELPIERQADADFSRFTNCNGVPVNELEESWVMVMDELGDRREQVRPKTKAGKF